MDDGEQAARWRAIVRRSVHAQLEGNDPLPGSQRYENDLREVRAIGAELFERWMFAGSDPERSRTWLRGAAELGIAIGTLQRVTGFGAWQARALLEEAHLDPSCHETELAAAAAFNLGIVLFDALLDHDDAGAAQLTESFDLATMASMAAHPHNPFAQHPSASVAFFGAVASEFFHASMSFDPQVRESIVVHLGRMFAAETALAASGRSVSPNLACWRAMRRKSALPMQLIALVVCNDTQDRIMRQRLVALGTQFGQVLWIIDDLADAIEDWRADNWSRPWWFLARKLGGLCATCTDHASWALEESGFVDAEARRLGRCLERLRRFSTNPRCPARTAAVATLTSWIA